MARPRFTLKEGLTFCSSQVSPNHTTTLRMHGSLGVPCIRRGLRLRAGRDLPKITRRVRGEPGLPELGALLDSQQQLP